MASYKYLSTLFIFIIPNCLGSSQSSLLEEELEAQSLIAKEDNLKFHRSLGPHENGYGEQWIVMPDGNGHPVLGTMFPDEDSSKKSRFSFTPQEVAEKVKFFFYSSGNENGVEFNVGRVNHINLNPSRAVKIICHGWKANSNSSITTNIRDAYLQENEENVIATDWSAYADDFYPLAVVATHPVGKHLGLLIDEIARTHKVPYENFHLIGHSLGAHVSGFAGNSTSEKIGRISGLDPALPGFFLIDDIFGRLDESDASFVDVIHTCAGLLGISSPIGHVDFYPNGGTPFQPGCGSIVPVETQACSHGRSHNFFTESIRKSSDFEAIRCSNWDNFKRHECDNVFEVMGEHVSRNASGIFYLKTKAAPPFAEGINGTLF